MKEQFRLNKKICKRCRDELAPLCNWTSHNEHYWNIENQVKCPVKIMGDGMGNYHSNLIEANKHCPYKWEHMVLCQDEIR